MSPASNNTPPEHALQQAKQLLGKLPVIGPVLWLYMNAPDHKHLFVSDLEWQLLPPVTLNQCKLFMQGQTPLAFASWAYVSDEVQQRLLAGQNRLAPADWHSGENLWLIDTVAPFGGVKELVQDLRNNQFAGKSIRQLVPATNAPGFQAVEWPPLNATTTPAETPSSD